MINLKTKYLIYFITLFIFASCSGSDNTENTTEAQVQENSTTIKSTPVPVSTPVPAPKATAVPAPKPTAVVKPTMHPVSNPELISFTAEDIKSIDYINIESVTSEEYHEAFAPDNDYYSEKFIEAWGGEIKIGTLDVEEFLLGIYEGTSIDEDIIDSLLIESFFTRNEYAAHEDFNVKVWLINNIFLICVKSNGACVYLVEDLLSKSNQFNPVSSSYNGIVMHTKGNSTFSDNLDDPTLLQVIMDSYYMYLGTGGARLEDVMYKVLDILENGIDPDKTFTQGEHYTYEQIPEGLHPLHLAIYVDAFTNSVKEYQGGIPNLLLSYGANPNLKAEFISVNNMAPEDGGQSGWTPLHIAVMTGQLDIIKLLLDYGAIINETDETQNTPLDYIWVPQNMISNFELFGVSTEEMDLPYTKESLNEVKQFLLESGAIHGNGTMSELAQMESTNALDQLSESLDQNDSDISYSTPSWSPDGSKIIFSSDMDGKWSSNIYVMDSDGTNITRLTTNEDSIDTSASWSPDGSKIVFSSDMDGQWGSNIYVMDSDGTNITRLTKQDSSDMSPSWSPDGSKIAFISDMHGQMFTNIYVMDSDGTNITRLTTKRNCWDEFPSWSPDGEKILFESCQYEGTEFRETIFVMDSDGTNMTMLIAWEDAGEDEFPYWSPDGSKIVFSSNLDGQLYGTKNIYVMDSDGTNITRLTTENSLDALPSWSPDGSKIVFSSDMDGQLTLDLYVMDSDGTNITRLTGKLK